MTCYFINISDWRPNPGASDKATGGLQWPPLGPEYYEIMRVNEKETKEKEKMRMKEK